MRRKFTLIFRPFRYASPLYASHERCFGWVKRSERIKLELVLTLRALSKPALNLPSTLRTFSLILI